MATVDLDLQVFDSSGSLVASSASWNNSYEIVEFNATRGATYEIRIRRWSGTDGVWYGIASDDAGAQPGTQLGAGDIREAVRVVRHTPHPAFGAAAG